MSNQKLFIFERSGKYPTEEGYIYRMADVISSLNLDEDFIVAMFDYFNHHGKSFFLLPASIGFHHRQAYGLVEHTLEVVMLCESISEAVLVDNPSIKIDRKVLITAALLHDVGKVYQYELDETHPYPAPCFKYTKSTKPTIDHATRVVIEFQEITGHPLPEEVALCILSHEGGWAKTGVSPESIEAAILASADLISSRMESRGWS